MSRVALCVVVGTLAVFIGSPSYPSESTDSGTLGLEAALDGQSYALGQPILLLVKVRNQGAKEFRDLGPMNPQIGDLALTLERDHKRLPWTGGQISAVFTDEGIRLPPGMMICQVVDLLYGFGDRWDSQNVNGQGVEAKSMPPGHYTLHTTLRARTGFVKSLPQVTVVGADLEFEVTDTPMDIPLEARAVVAPSAPGAPSVQLTPAAKKALLDRAADSRSYYLLWRRVRASESDYPIQDAIALLMAQKRSPILMAGVLNHRCKNLQLHNSEKLQWIAGTRAAMKDPALLAVLDTWRLRIEQHRYFYEF